MLMSPLRSKEYQSRVAVGVLLRGEGALAEDVVAEPRREREGVLHPVGLPGLPVLRRARTRLAEQRVRPRDPGAVGLDHLGPVARVDLERRLEAWVRRVARAPRGAVVRRGHVRRRARRTPASPGRAGRVDRRSGPARRTSTTKASDGSLNIRCRPRIRRKCSPSSTARRSPSSATTCRSTSVSSGTLAASNRGRVQLGVDRDRPGHEPGHRCDPRTPAGHDRACRCPPPGTRRPATAARAARAGRARARSSRSSDVGAAPPGSTAPDVCGSIRDQVVMDGIRRSRSAVSRLRSEETASPSALKARYVAGRKWATSPSAAGSTARSPSEVERLEQHPVEAADRPRLPHHRRYGEQDRLRGGGVGRVVLEGDAGRLLAARDQLGPLVHEHAAQRSGEPVGRGLQHERGSAVDRIGPLGQVEADPALPRHVRHLRERAGPASRRGRASVSAAAVESSGRAEGGRAPSAAARCTPRAGPPRRGPHRPPSRRGHRRSPR